MKVIKKIVASKDFIYLLIIQIILCVGFFVMIYSSYDPVIPSETHQIRLYSPSVRMESDGGWGKHDEKIIKIRYNDYDFIYSSRVRSNAKTNTDLTLLEQLQMEDYLEITYVIYPKTYEIVEIHGKDHVYYTIDEYNSFYKGNLIAAILISAWFEVLYLLVAFGWIWYYVLGKSIPETTRLRKKHPVEKHLYDDEENEFSPYKQKLIEQEREEE